MWTDSDFTFWPLAALLFWPPPFYNRLKSKFYPPRRNVVHFPLGRKTEVPCFDSIPQHVCREKQDKTNPIVRFSNAPLPSSFLSLSFRVALYKFSPRKAICAPELSPGGLLSAVLVLTRCLKLKFEKNPDLFIPFFFLPFLFFHIPTGPVQSLSNPLILKHLPPSLSL